MRVRTGRPGGVGVGEGEGEGEGGGGGGGGEGEGPGDGEGGIIMHGASHSPQERLVFAIDPAQHDADPPGSVPQSGPPQRPQDKGQHARREMMPWEHVGSAPRIVARRPARVVIGSAEANDAAGWRLRGVAAAETRRKARGRARRRSIVHCEAL